MLWNVAAHNTFRVLSVTAIATVVGLGVLGGALAYFEPWSWAWTVEAYPVDNGVLWGQVGWAWGEGTDALYWKVDGITYSPPGSYFTQAYVAGEDECVGYVPWIVEMDKNASSYTNTTVDTGGVEGGMLNCQSQGGDHEYRVFGSHCTEATSGSDGKCASGYVNPTG